MRNTWTIASTTYADLTRRPIYYITLGAFALLVYCSSFLTQFTFFQEINMVREMGLASITLWGFIIIVSLTGVIVTQELEDRTAVTLLSKPLRRSAFLLGKYFGLMMALFMGMTVLAGVLFYTLWWMAKGKMFGNPGLAAWCTVGGCLWLFGGVAVWAIGAGEKKPAVIITLIILSGCVVGLTLYAVWRLVELARTRWERGTQPISAEMRAEDASARIKRLGFAAIVIGAVLLMLAMEFSRGTLSDGDGAFYRLRVQSGHETVWEFVGSFMQANGRTVIAGFVLCYLQAAVLASICVSVAAFAPPVISVAAATLVFLLGNLSSYMLGSIERMNVKAVSVAGRLLTYLLPNLSYFNLQTHFSEGRIISLEYLLLATLHAGIYAALAFTIACSLFERREIR